MNILLLYPHQIANNSCVQLSNKQSSHITQVLKLTVGDNLKVGVINGNIGSARVLDVGEMVTIEILQLDTPPPATLPLTLILALPRPQMIKRILQTVACMGVEKLCLIQTSKVEKSFWQSPSVTDLAIEEQLILGLEQGVATQMPVVKKYNRFRPFAEDILPTLTSQNSSFIAHPGDYPECPRIENTAHTTLAIGPEGGFIEKEVNYFEQAGFKAVQVGQRILKVETAVTVLLAKMF